MYAWGKESKLTLYALVDEEQEPGTWIFDGIAANSLLGAPRHLLDRDWEPETWLVALEKPGQLNACLLPEARGGWLILTLTLDPASEANGTLLPVRASPEAGRISVRVDSIEALRDSRLLRKLDAFSRLVGAPRASKREITRLLDRATQGMRCAALAIYDVGQANWNAVVDTKCHPACLSCQREVRLFFDLGMPTYWYHRTLPQSPTDPLALCCHRGYSVPVILSHWHQDHWAGAVAQGSAYGSRGLNIQWDSRAIRDHQWLVPSQGRNGRGQRLSPTAWRLVLALHWHGNLRVWPTLLNSVQSARGDRIVKCYPVSGPSNNNNDTGLALFLARHHYMGYGFILAPGDAQYDTVYHYVPPGLPIYHLVASHHGGKIKTPNAIPTATSRRSRLAISHGGGYGHPCQKALLAHAAQGWLFPCETSQRHSGGNGDIYLV